MRRGGSVSGAVSLVMIFCVLCLAVFATLTYVTADREQKLSELGAESAAAYYAADAEATRCLAALRRGETPEGITLTESHDSAGAVEEFSVPVNENQELRVKVRLTPDGSCKILRWELAFAGDWEANDTIDIWDGDLFAD